MADEQGNRIDCNNPDNLLTFKIQLFQFLASGALESYASEIRGDIRNKKNNDPRVKRVDALLQAMNQSIFPTFKLNLISRKNIDKYVAEIEKGSSSKRSMLDEFDSKVGNEIIFGLMDKLENAIIRDLLESEESASDGNSSKQEEIATMRNLLETQQIVMKRDVLNSPEIPDLACAWISYTFNKARDRIKSAQPAFSEGVNTVNASLPA